MATTETVRDIGSQMAKWAQQHRQAELNTSLGAELNPDNKTPFQDQNAFLADQVKQIGEASAERARLRSEDAKAEYDAQVRANILKSKELEENRQQQADLTTAQNAQRNIQSAQAIWQQLNAINLEPYRGMTMHNMPNDVLARLTQLGQEWNNLRSSAPEMNLPPYDSSFLETGIGIFPVAPEKAIAPSNQKHPATFEDGRYSQQTVNADGSIEVRLPSGEVFKGSTQEVIEAMGKAKVHTSRWAQEQKAKLEQVVNTGNGYEARFSTGERYLGNTPDEVMNNIARSEAERAANGMPYSSISDWYIDQNADKIMNSIAKKLDLSSTDEMVKVLKGLGEDSQQHKSEVASMAFMAAHPEFPGTEAAGEAVDKIMAERGWEFTKEHLADAHAIAVQRGKYQPLTPEMIAVANGAPVQHTRPTPPPLVRGSNPESSFNQRSLAEAHWAQKPNGQWEVPLAELRAMAIRQQLGEK